MKTYKIIFFSIIACCISFCTLKKSEKKEQIKPFSSQEIELVYFQKWVGDQEKQSSGIDFYIKFKKPLSKIIQLKKIYFHNQETTFEQENKTTFVAHFYQKTAKDLILEGNSTQEYGNEPPEITKPKFDLKPNETVIEYLIDGAVKYVKLTPIKERKMILYPSRNLPMN